MNILLNAEILIVGGSVQVGDSIIREFSKCKKHHFVLVYPHSVEMTAQDMSKLRNFTVIPYEMPKYNLGAVIGKNHYLDDIVEQYHIDVVFTIMGPARWKPKVPHLVGFARCQMVIPESPFWKMLTWWENFKYSIQNYFIGYSFALCSEFLWTENEFISARVREKMTDKKVFTVTSNYNQVYDQKEKWDNSLSLPKFDGMTLLTIAANYPHKYLKIIPLMLRHLKKIHQDVKIRVVMTVTSEELEGYADDLKDNIVFLGFITINQCPYLYEQSDIMFMPSLLECFSACYAEAMRMRKPILVPNLGFAKGLCGDAACYYEPVSIEDCAEAVAKLYHNKSYRDELVTKGETQIKNFNTYQERAARLLNIIENELYDEK